MHSEKIDPKKLPFYHPDYKPPFKNTTWASKSRFDGEDDYNASFEAYKKDFGPSGEKRPWYFGILLSVTDLSPAMIAQKALVSLSKGREYASQLTHAGLKKEMITLGEVAMTTAYDVAQYSRLLGHKNLDTLNYKLHMHGGWFANQHRDEETRNTAYSNGNKYWSQFPEYDHLRQNALESMFNKNAQDQFMKDIAETGQISLDLQDELLTQKMEILKKKGLSGSVQVVIGPPKMTTIN